MQIDRRVFLAALAVPLYPAVPLTVLTVDESKVVEALCSQIIPSDDAPGAKEAGVMYYIERQLSGSLARFVDVYKTGIPALNSACRAQTGKAFTAVSFADQKKFLKWVEATNAPPNNFFQTVIDHTMQGFYGSPMHGGNKDEASWKMLEITDVMEGHKHGASNS